MKSLVRSRVRVITLGGVLLLLLAFPYNLFAAAITPVTPADIGVTWANALPAADTRSGGTATIGAAPAGNSYGAYSLLMTSDSAPFGSSQAKAQFVTGLYVGTNLSDISSLGYWDYRSSSSTTSAGQRIGLNLGVDYAGNGVSSTFLVFEPIYQPGGLGALLSNTWQQWDAYAGGNAKWWSSNAIPGVCGGSCYVTWNTIVANNPSAKIKSIVGFNIGSGWVGQFSGATDGFTVGTSSGTTTYDFDIPQCSSDCYVAPAGNNGNGGTSFADAKLTIQAAVNQVTTGGNVHVAAGTYNENVSISRAMTLLGAQAGNAVAGRTYGAASESNVVGVTLSGNVAVFRITGPDVTVNGFAITDSVTSGAAYAFSISGGGDRAVVRNNVMDTITTPDPGSNGTAQGVYLTSSGPDDVSIVNNAFRNISSVRSAKAVLIGDNGGTDPSQNTLIKGNEVSGITSTTRGAYAVAVGNVPNVSGLKIQDNTISGLSGAWAHAIGLEGDTPGVQVTGNTISVVVAPGADRVAVYFEVNPSFGSAQVHNNNFNVTSAAFGIAVNPALSGGSVSGTCNWWGVSSGPGGAGATVSPNVTYAPWLNAPAPGGACLGGTAKGYKTQALADLAAIGPINKDTDKRVADAMDDIQSSLDRPNWDGDNRLDGKHADKVFKDEKHAAKSLEDIKGVMPAGAMQAINDLLAADQLIAQTAIDDMTPGGDPKKLAEANKEMDKALGEIAKGHYSNAINHYKNAWKQAQKA